MDLINTVMTALANTLNTLSTVAMALFAFFVWRLNVKQHHLTHYAQLGVVASDAFFDKSRNTLLIEIMLVNRSSSPGVIQGWKALVKDGDFQISVADGELVKTTLLKTRRYIGGTGWGVPREEPTAFSLKKEIVHNLTDEARVDVIIIYVGGKSSVTEVREVVPIRLDERP